MLRLAALSGGVDQFFLLLAELRSVAGQLGQVLAAQLPLHLQPAAEGEEQQQQEDGESAPADPARPALLLLLAGLAEAAWDDAPLLSPARHSRSLDLEQEVSREAQPSPAMPVVWGQLIVSLDTPVPLIVSPDPPPFIVQNYPFYQFYICMLP